MIDKKTLVVSLKKRHARTMRIQSSNGEQNEVTAMTPSDTFRFFAVCREMNVLACLRL
jgi:hypothetical protein